MFFSFPEPVCSSHVAPCHSKRQIKVVPSVVTALTGLTETNFATHTHTELRRQPKLVVNVKVDVSRGDSEASGLTAEFRIKFTADDASSFKGKDVCVCVLKLQGNTRPRPDPTRLFITTALLFFLLHHVPFPLPNTPRPNRSVTPIYKQAFITLVRSQPRVIPMINRPRPGADGGRGEEGWVLSNIRLSPRKNISATVRRRRRRRRRRLLLVDIGRASRLSVVGGARK